MYKEIKYKLPNGVIITQDSIERIEDGAIIPFDLGNRDYQDYLAWLDAGNIPESCDVQ